MVLLALMSPEPPAVRTYRAHDDTAFSARIVARRPIYYAAGAAPALDRPAHVRAVSGLAWVDGALAAIQDDARFVALVDPAQARATAIALPPGADGKRLHDDSRGTKALKLDLESCFAVRRAGATELFAFGSGTLAAREVVVVLSFAPALPVEVRVVDASALYRTLHQARAFSGSELNVEGAVLRDDSLLLFQRGNGAAREGRLPQNAIAELSWPAVHAYLERDGDPALAPSPTRIARYELGTIENIPLTFTDAALAPDGTLVFLASAEDSADSVSDGGVFGARIGTIDRDGEARMGPLLDEAGAPARIKAEGIAVAPHDPSLLYLAVDMDDPFRASELLEVRLTGSPARDVFGSK